MNESINKSLSKDDSKTKYFYGIEPETLQVLNKFYIIEKEIGGGSSSIIY